MKEIDKKCKKTAFFVRIFPRTKKPAASLSPRKGTSGVVELNFCVRKGNRWYLYAIAAGLSAQTVFENKYFLGRKSLCALKTGYQINI